jgi:hypothetical protein
MPKNKIWILQAGILSRNSMSKTAYKSDIK